MTRRTRVYIAGPYTQGGMDTNVYNALRMWHVLWEAGYSPFCPHLSLLLHLHQTRPYADWLDYDMDWLACCDAMLRLEGESSGADKEAAAMARMGRSVYTNVADLFRERPATIEVEP